MRNQPSRFDWLARVAAMTATEKEKAMLWALAYHADLAGECHPAVATLALESGCGSMDTARRRLHKLAKKELIEIIPRRVPFHSAGKTFYLNLYRLKLPAGGPTRPSKALQGHTPKDDLAKREDDLAKQGDDLAELCKANPMGSPSRKQRQRDHAALPGHFKTDYQRTEVPEISDYTDIHGCPDPVLAAMAVTGEKSKQGWGHWCRVLSRARREYGREPADRLFKDCVAETWGEAKAGECRSAGAVLNVKLAKVLCPLTATQTHEPQGC